MLPEEADVIVVEDNLDNRFILQELLRRMDVKSCTAYAAGWQMFKQVRERKDLHVDLILLDIQLPGDDGYVILNRIRETPILSSATVVAVTANVMQHDVERMREAGFHSFIGKPFNHLRFSEQVRRILSGKPVWDSPRG